MTEAVHIYSGHVVMGTSVNSPFTEVCIFLSTQTDQAYPFVACLYLGKLIVSA